jgi:hypothetical protein
VENLLDLYTDYLISSFGQTSATGFSRLVDNEIKHDSITRLLRDADFSSKTLWQTVKPLVRKHQAEDACLIFDDFIIEKAYTDENDIICWHPRSFKAAERQRNQRPKCVLSHLQRWRK